MGFVGYMGFAVQERGVLGFDTVEWVNVVLNTVTAISVGYTASRLARLRRDLVEEARRLEEAMQRNDNRSRTAKE